MANPRLTEIAGRHVEAKASYASIKCHDTACLTCRGVGGAPVKWPCDAAILVQRIEWLEQLHKHVYKTAYTSDKVVVTEWYVKWLASEPVTTPTEDGHE